jgi:predicted glycoside hydrolase/deacetylase ChbG (UPF0249 family)
MTTRRIALVVDDFGLHEGIDAAVLRLAERRHVTAVSCMVGVPGWRRGGGQRLRSLDATRLDIGLHLDLTEAPLRRGTRRSLRQWIVDAYTGRLAREAVRGEIDAQLDAFERTVGRAPDHVDGHQHVHQLPGIRDLLVQALRERHPAPRPWLRCTRPEPVPALKPWLIAALGSAGLTRLARSAGLAQNHRLLGVYDFQGDAHRYERRLAAWLRAAREGDLLMCHPSLPTHAATDPILQARRVEADVLCSPLFADLLAREDIVLWPITRIQASQR